MGRLSNVEHGVLKTDDSLAAHIAFAEERSADFTTMIEDWISSNGVNAEPIEDDPNDEPAGPQVARSGITELDLKAAGVGSVIWCTGFTAPSTGSMPASPTTMDDRSTTEGSPPFFLGFPWLHSRKSGIIHGIDEDARFIAETIAARA